MSSNRKDLLLSLAAIFQAAKLVKELAWRGTADEKYLEVAINSLFKINSESLTDIYGEPKNLRLGLIEIINIFSSNSKNNPKCQEIARYTFSIIHLERKLIRNKEMLSLIGNGIKKAEIQVNQFSLLHENVIANLAGIYTDTLSKFTFRIHISGSPGILNNPKTANKIRAVLLAGIRAAVLWRQIGGSRLQLIFSRKKLVHLAKCLV